MKNFNCSLTKYTYNENVRLHNLTLQQKQHIIYSKQNQHVKQHSIYYGLFDLLKPVLAVLCIQLANLKQISKQNA